MTAKNDVASEGGMSELQKQYRTDDEWTVSNLFASGEGDRHTSADNTRISRKENGQISTNAEQTDLDLRFRDLLDWVLHSDTCCDIVGL